MATNFEANMAELACFILLHLILTSFARNST